MFMYINNNNYERIKNITINHNDAKNAYSWSGGTAK